MSRNMMKIALFAIPLIFVFSLSTIANAGSVDWDEHAAQDYWKSAVSKLFDHWFKPDYDTDDGNFHYGSHLRGKRGTTSEGGGSASAGQAPIPSSVLLLASGLVGIVALRRRFKQ